MNTRRLVVWLGIGVVVAMGAYAWVLLAPPKSASDATDPSTTPIATSTAADESKPLRGRAALTDLLALGRELECVLRHETVDGAPIEGTAFLSKGRVRGDFVSGTGSSSVLTSMILANNDVYVWSVIDGQGWGVKRIGVPSGEAPVLDTREPVSLTTTVRYDCTPWTRLDNSVFAPPSDVLFRDVVEVLERGMEEGTTFEGAPSLPPATPATPVTSACDLCDRVEPDEARDACRASLECE